MVDNRDKPLAALAKMLLDNAQDCFEGAAFRNYGYFERRERIGKIQRGSD